MTAYCCEQTPALLHSIPASASAATHRPIAVSLQERRSLAHTNFLCLEIEDKNDSTAIDGRVAAASASDLNEDDAFLTAALLSKVNADDLDMASLYAERIKDCTERFTVLRDSPELIAHSPTFADRKFSPSPHPTYQLSPQSPASCTRAFSALQLLRQQAETSSYRLGYATIADYSREMGKKFPKDWKTKELKEALRSTHRATFSFYPKSIGDIAGSFRSTPECSWHHPRVERGDKEPFEATIDAIDASIACEELAEKRLELEQQRAYVAEMADLFKQENIDEEDVMYTPEMLEAIKDYFEIKMPHRKIDDALSCAFTQFKKIDDPVEGALYLHNTIIRIHPFTDGNRRIARQYMNLVLSRYGLPILEEAEVNGKVYRYNYDDYSKAIIDDMHASFFKPVERTSIAHMLLFLQAFHAAHQ